MVGEGVGCNIICHFYISTKNVDQYTFVKGTMIL